MELEVEGGALNSTFAVPILMQLFVRVWRCACCSRCARASRVPNKTSAKDIGRYGRLHLHSENPRTTGLLKNRLCKPNDSARAW